MKAFKMAVISVFFAALLIAGCSDNDGSGGGRQSSGNVVLSGMVMNNHTEADGAARAIVGATVILVKAEDIERADSISPVEDLADEKNRYPAVTADSNGYYQFTRADFSNAYPADGNYFIFVEPPAASEEFLPGGNASRTSLTLGRASDIVQDIILTDGNGPDAAYIGSTVCLVCHPQKHSIKHTLHFTGIRKIGTAGTITNGLMDMNDTSVYDLSANNKKMLDLFTSPATQYNFADDPANSFLLGKDAGGLYFQMTSADNPKFYLKYTYGGETGNWRGLFMTTVYASDGTYAPDHGIDGNDYAYHVMLPVQYNEDGNSINGEQFVTYHADRWDFAGTGNKGFTADPEQNSFDLACAACHGATRIKTVNSGLAAERKVAVFAEDENGYDFDGTLSQMNVGCEKCHGPGSNHVNAGGRGKMIISPEKLTAGRLAMICGACHIRGENHTEFGGGAALKADGSENYETFRPGMRPAQFFGSSDDTGKNIAPFGTLEIESLTTNGYLEPVNFETNAESSWINTLFGAKFNHSKKNQQHYQDLVRSIKFRNPGTLLTCDSCHDAHGSAYRHMVRYNADNNAVCLPCHYGPGRVFPNIAEEMVFRLQNESATAADRTAIGNDVEAHIFDKTGTQQMAPYDPEGTAMGRCTLCHMPKTARSADWRNALVTQLGQYRHGDITAHTFDVMATEAVNEMGAARGINETTPAGITDPCGRCHAFAGLN